MSLVLVLFPQQACYRVVPLPPGDDACNDVRANCIPAV
ncbi:hypothetical protein SCNRRL3882_2367 [Streptomyces chartreusis NRRL 3882]|uniref:Uncharacterized protein n=1 Tax=Streptomyces chartreusis NRRL 3882 TaxID=1079985 RepID=A0A2N9B6D2_STRCX|nr:hypothetical protein SCNRRL3882_2367 [Streptomyces chartreusis NRRL 3882]